MPRIALLLVAAALSAAACAPSALARGARSSDAGLPARLASAMRGAGAHSGAYVVNSTQGNAEFRWRERTPRILASNTKLFTTSTVLARYGADGTLGTEIRGQGSLEAGTWKGDLYGHAIDRRHNRDNPVPESLTMIRANSALRARAAEDRAVLLDACLLKAAGMTWEDALSLAGNRLDKAALWTSLIPSMGYMALLRNHLAGEVRR